MKKEKPDVIVNIVDATNLGRSLFFTTQLLKLGIPIVVALNKSDINKKKQTNINSALLSQKLGCPIVETTSTTEDGLKAVIEKAVSVANSTQAAPYHQEKIDFTDKSAVDAADRKRFEFVNRIVKEVENRKVLTKDKNISDKIDKVLTNKWLGIPIFAVVMFLLFQISQVWIGTPIADMLVGWLETFQSWVGELLENVNPLLSALLVEGVIGGVIAVIGFLPLVMVMYFLIVILEDCGYMSRVAVILDPIFKKENVVGTLAVCFVGLENLIDTEELALMEGAGAEVAGIMAVTKVAALAYLMFNLYTPPCFAAIGGLIAVLIFAAILIVLMNNTNKVMKAEYELER